MAINEGGGLKGLGLWCLTPLSKIFQLYHGWIKEGRYNEGTLNVPLCL